MEIFQQVFATSGTPTAHLGVYTSGAWQSFEELSGGNRGNAVSGSGRRVVPSQKNGTRISMEAAHSVGLGVGTGLCRASALCAAGLAATLQDACCQCVWRAVQIGITDVYGVATLGVLASSVFNANAPSLRIRVCNTCMSGRSGTHWFTIAYSLEYI